MNDSRCLVLPTLSSVFRRKFALIVAIATAITLGCAPAAPSPESDENGPAQDRNGDDPIPEVRAGWECLDLPDRLPEGEGSNAAAEIDCSIRELQLSGGWCDWICLTAQHDLGHAERLQIRADKDRRRYTLQGCDPSAGQSSFLWRAPYAGSWVIDTNGSENATLSAILDPRCGAKDDIVCTFLGRQQVVELAAGEPIFVIASNFVGSNEGPHNILLNITPLTAREEGADCLDGADNDADGLADCDDPDCASSPECTTQACANETLPSELPVRAEGDLSVECHLNRFTSWCAGAKTRERIFAWQAPLTGRVVFDASDSEFKATLSVREGACVGPEIGSCPYYDSYGPAMVATGVDVTAGEWYYVMVSAVDDNQAFQRNPELETRIGYVLDIRLAEEESGERCWDGLDNDGNGLADANDPQCWD